MVGFHWQYGVVQQGSGPAALAASLTNNGPPEVALFQQGVASNPGEIDFSVSASGGSGSYTYAWSVNIIDDGIGMCSIDTQGTTNQSVYNDARLIGGTNHGAPATFNVQCTVSDGSSSVGLTSSDLACIALY